MGDVSDIPVGSPPVPPGRHAAPGGWYPDPVDPAQERYWDGWQWSRNTRPAGRRRAGRAGLCRVPRASRGRSTASPAGISGLPAGDHRTGDDDRRWRTAGRVVVAGAGRRHRQRDHFRGGQHSRLSDLANHVDQAPGLCRRRVRRTAVRRAPPALDIAQLLTPREQLIITALSLGVGMLYHVVFLRWKAATVGKLICGLRVVPVDRGLIHRDAGLEHRRDPLRVPGDAWYYLDTQRICSAGLAVPAVASQATGHSRSGREDPGDPARRVRPLIVTTSLRNSRGAWRFRAFDDYIEPRSERSGRSHPVKPNGSGATRAMRSFRAAQASSPKHGHGGGRARDALPGRRIGADGLG